MTPWPKAVKKAIGANLRVLQHGERPASHCKALRDFAVPLLELWHRSGQRVICTTAYSGESGRIHVLDAFVKDSGDGRKMRRTDKERIELRAKELKNRMDEVERTSQKAKNLRDKLH